MQTLPNNPHFVQLCVFPSKTQNTDTEVRSWITSRFFFLFSLYCILFHYPSPLIPTSPQQSSHCCPCPWVLSHSKDNLCEICPLLGKTCPRLAYLHSHMTGIIRANRQQRVNIVLKHVIIRNDSMSYLEILNKLKIKEIGLPVTVERAARGEIKAGSSPLQPNKELYTGG